MHVCIVTRNKSVSATTLHSLMTIHMYAMMKRVHLEIHFVTDLSGLPKLIKTGERILWFDYATNLDEPSIRTIFEPFEKDIRVLVYPAVLESIDWDMFRKKTLANSTEPVSQRALTFDTTVGKKLADGLYDVTATSARVWVMDSKPIDKKLRGDKVQIRLPTESYEAMFDCLLKKLGVKIAAATKAQVICHFTHECLGNILETPGVYVGK